MERFRNIVVPTDFSPLASAATARAAELARTDGAALHLVHSVGFPAIVAPYGTSVPVAVWEDLRQAARQQLEIARKEAEQASGQTVTAEISESPDAATAIGDAAEAHRADLIVMGSHGHGGLKRAFLGSVTERTLRTLDRSVLAVKESPEDAARPIEKILVAVDFSPQSDAAVDLAVDLSQRLGATVEVLHAFGLPYDHNPYLSLGSEFQQEMEAKALKGLEGVRARFALHDVPAAIQLQHGKPSVVISEVATRMDCQLIVMGCRGLSGLEHVMLGSVAERTLRAAPCSVLCVKTEDR